MAENNTNYQSTQTFLIECSRANSSIDLKDGGDFNAKWTNETNFNLKRGDVVSVEMMALNVEGGGGAGALEFTGDAVFIDGTEKKYCDNKVLLEVFFYMNNNNTYSVGLPFRHPTGSFNALAANKYMPIVKSELLTSNLMGLTASNSTLGFLGDVVQGAPPVINSGIIVAAQSHAIYQYNTGTVAVPVWVNALPAPGNTPVISIQMAGAGDPNPGGGAFCTFAGMRQGNLNAANSVCYWVPNLFLNINDTTGAQNAMTVPIQIMTAGVGGRLQVIFTQPTILQTAGTAAGFAQGALCAATPSTIDGSSEMGTVNYDNIDQTGMASTYTRRFGNNLNNQMFHLGAPQAGGDPLYSQFPNTTYGDGSTQNATVAYDFEKEKCGFRCGNRRMDMNGKPYIFSRNDFYGQGRQKPDATGYYPKLMPMTAFILLEASELFTDAESLANIINDRLHEALSPFDTDIPDYDNYVSNDSQYKNPRFKSSSTIPAINSIGWYDPLVYNNPTYKWRDMYSAEWTKILPVKYGGTTKVQPANFSAGWDFINSTVGQIINYENSNQRKECYLNVVNDDWLGTLADPATGDKVVRNVNTIYGNCGMANFYKEMVGDRMQRLELNPMLTPTSAEPAPAGDGLCNVGCPIITNQKLKYVFMNFQDGGTGRIELGTQTKKGQVLFTNIKYPQRDPNGNKLYNETAWRDYAESVRNYELYGNKEANASTTYESQLQDTTGWCMEMDLGRTDDQLSCLEIADNRTTNMTPIKPWWWIKYPVLAEPTAAGNYGTGCGTPPVAVNPAGPLNAREIISPAFSCRAFGNSVSQFNWAECWGAYRGLGKIWVETKFDKNWKNTTKQMQDLFPGDPNAVDTANQIIYDDNFKTYPEGNTIDVDFMESLNLGIYPYEYTDSAGENWYMCAFRCMYDTAVEANLAPVLPPAIPSDLTTTAVYEVGCITWGIPFGVSPAAMDNHKIVPMNADQRNCKNPIENVATSALIQPLNTQQPNRTNFIFMGANNPTFSFNAAKNRFEFLNLQTDNLLTDLNQNTASLSKTNPQLGEPVGIVEGEQADAVFATPDPINLSSEADNYKVGDRMKNQGIRAEIGGVGIFKVWLCPPDYAFPENINPVNYWDNSTPDATEENRQEIIKDCVEGSDAEWEGCLLNRLGFSIEDFIPRYGRQHNRFDPNTYNNPNVNIIGTGIKPLMLNNSFNGVINPSLNLYFKFPIPSGTEVANGVPKFLHGFNENQEVLLSTQALPLTANDAPISTISPFFIVYSDIVANRQYQTGSTGLPAIFYCMKNYANGSFLYGYGSSFSIMVNQDRALSQINTEIRNPTDGKLAKLSPNSVIVYKIQRQAPVPAPQVDVFGQLEAQPPPDPNLVELTKIFNEEKKLAGMVAGRTPNRSAPGSSISDYSNPNHLHNMVRGNIQVINNEREIREMQELGTQTQNTGSSRGTQTKGMPDSIRGKLTDVMIRAILAKIPINTLTPSKLKQIPKIVSKALDKVLDFFADPNQGISRSQGLDEFLVGMWESTGGDIDAIGEGILGTIGNNIQIRADGGAIFDDTGGGIPDARSRRTGTEYQLMITSPELMDAIIRSIRENRIDELPDIFQTGMEREHLIAEGVTRHRGEPPMFFDVPLIPGAEGSVFARLGRRYDAMSELERIVASDPAFGRGREEQLAPMTNTDTFEYSEENLRDAPTRSRVEGKKEEASTAGSTTAPPSTAGSTQTTSRVEPRGQPEEQSDKKK
jgi:hypothetical protein